MLMMGCWSDRNLNPSSHTFARGSVGSYGTFGGHLPLVKRSETNPYQRTGVPLLARDITPSYIYGESRRSSINKDKLVELQGESPSPWLRPRNDTPHQLI